MSLITELRCQKFEDVVGNNNIKHILQTIIATPEDKPRNIIFAGSWGCAKTSLARVFAKSLNSSCTETSKYLMEIDSSTVAKVEDMRELLPYLSIPSKELYKVVIFDEAHLISKTAFSLLLKLIEENTKNLFFIFCTTEVHKLLDTIKSRSITLYVEDLTKESMYTYLKQLVSKGYFSEEYLKDDTLIEILFMQSGGHFRDLIQQIELLQVQGIELYKKTVPDYKELYYAILQSSKEAVQRILNLPLVLIEDSWDFFVNNYDIPENVIISHLQYRANLRTTTDWQLFFTIVGAKKQTEGVSRIRR